MHRIVFIFSFIISIASVAYGIMLSNDLRKKNPDTSVFTSILYQQILIFVFALYGIWGQVFSHLFLASELISETTIEKISTFNTFLAIPFLLISWWFLIHLFLITNKTAKSQLKTTLIISISLTVVTGFYLLLQNGAGLFEASRQIFFFENLVVYMVVTTTILTFNKKEISTTKKIVLALSILFIGSLMSFGVLFYTLNQWVTVVFIILFFITQTWVPIVFRIFIHPKSNAIPVDLSFESFCTKFEISKRESEIIAEICAGHSNKEIAEKLFITLQTVKDHTSRIYLKTAVKNRTQLANLVRKYS